VAIDGARNAGLLAARILGASDPALRDRLRALAAAQGDVARAADARVAGGD
jgi:5-(carboxyamino)imidazole ribonucleotide mutase